MPSFQEALFALPSNRLRTIAENRMLNVRGAINSKRELVELLADQLNDHRSAQDAILRCNYRQLRLLQICTAEETGRSFTWQKLLEMAGGPDADQDVSRVMSELEDLGLAIRYGVTLLVPEAVRRQTPASLADRYSAMRLLNAYDAPTIRTICDRLGLQGDFTTKTANINHILRALSSSIPHLRFNPPLTAEELAVLEYMVKNGGSATPLEVAADVLGGRTDDFFRYEWQNRWKTGKERNAVDGLLARGILYVAASGYGYNFYLVIPGDLLRMLTGDSIRQLWAGDAPAPRAPRDVIAGTWCQESLTRDAIRLLSFFGIHEASQTNTGHVHKTALKTAMKQLSIPDEQYVSFLYCLLKDSSYIEPQGEKGVYTLTDPGWEWLCSTAFEQAAYLFSGWKYGVAWGEMYDDPMQKRSDFRYRQHAQFLRNALLNTLATSNAASEFVSLESIAESVAYQCPLALNGAQGVGLVNTISAFTTSALTECLSWLGIVELGVAKSAAQNSALTGTDYANLHTSDVRGVRLSAWGRQILQLDPMPEQTAPSELQFILQANAEIFVPPYLRADILYRVLVFADVPDTVGSTTVRLSKDSIRKALDRGHNLPDIIEFLRSHSRTGIPQNVEYMLNEVGARHGHIHVGLAQMYIKVDSPILMKELCARKELKGMFVREITDTVAIISGKDLDKVLRDLRKAGYFPVSDDQTATNQHEHDLYLNQAGAADADAPQNNAPGDFNDDDFTPANAANSLSQISIDWDKMAQQDGEPYTAGSRSAPSDIARPSGAHENQNLIRVILSNAAIGRTVVDMVYRPVGLEPRRIQFEPTLVSSTAVVGFESDEGEDQITINISQILWARITSRKF